MELHLTNGTAMLDYLSDHNINLGEVESFNEAMCRGVSDEDIFSSEFCDMRSAYHGVTLEDYQDLVTESLTKFLRLEYELIHLYFDDCVHCQINLLTVLGYLDMKGYFGDIILHLIDDKYLVQKDVKINCNGFYDEYIRIVIKNVPPKMKLPKVMEERVVEYLQNVE